MVRCKSLEILQEYFDEWDRLSSFIYEHLYYIRYDLIGHNLLKVQDDKSDGGCEFLVNHGCRTTCYGSVCGGSNSSNADPWVPG